MMAGLRLEVFDTALSPDGEERPLVEASLLEETRVAAFEQGYCAGWDDAIAAQMGDQAQIRSDLARNLQSLAFTFHDARNHGLQAVRPLILEMTNSLLPAVARAALGPMVLEALTPMVEELADGPITLVLNAADRERVEALVAGETGLPMKMEEEPSLSEGQVYIRLGTTEAKVDLAQVTTDISAAVRDFFTLSSRGNTHG
ncbi:flagellar biosynthesis protein [Tabrizicola caldifontis]|uniref:flagellar biosynthesis protein n=1 Tax=Tabrizicola caldifontis TaxID=2528036 RepID=UPI001F0DC98E|nr:flagellar biosynthesis protein [Rhodobacter sp. YIM 73028]